MLGEAGLPLRDLPSAFFPALLQRDGQPLGLGGVTREHRAQHLGVQDRLMTQHGLEPLIIGAALPQEETVYLDHTLHRCRQ